MKNGFVLIMVLCLSFFLEGCGIGGMWMNGNPFPTPTKPHLQKWEKIDMTPEGRRDDSFACGGSRDDDKPFTRGNIESLMLPGETPLQTRERLGSEWVTCMKGKGYILKRN